MSGLDKARQQKEGILKNTFKNQRPICSHTQKSHKKNTKLKAIICRKTFLAHPVPQSFGPK